MSKTKKSWREKLEDSKDLPKIVTIKQEMAGRFGTKPGDKMVIVRPLDVDRLIRKIKKGKVVVQKQITEALAKKYKVDLCCPLTAGIFTGIAARASEEDRAAGKKELTPYWRVLKNDGKLNPKFPEAPRLQELYLKAEGHKIEKNKVVDFESKLQKL